MASEAAEKGTALSEMSPSQVASLFHPAASTALSIDPRSLLHAPPPALPKSLERAERVERAWAALVEAGVPARTRLVPPREATDEELALVHTAAHLDAVLPGEEKSAEGGAHDEDTYFNAHTGRAARLAAGAVVDVLLGVVRGDLRNGFAVVRPPGHHAHSFKAGGFCHTNNVAVAVRAAQRACGALRRVAIVDWDIHHGDGTQQVFEEDPDVLYVSVHRYQNGTFYPRTGALSETGSGPGAGRTVNVPLPAAGVGDVAFERCFERVVLPVLRDFGADAVVVSAGFDAAEGDPLGECLVSPAGFGRMTRSLMAPDVARGGRLVLALEGGYNAASVAAGVVACARALLGDDPGPALDPRDAMSRRAAAKHDAKLRFVDAMLEEVREAQAPHWPRLAAEDYAPGPDLPRALSGHEAEPQERGEDDELTRKLAGLGIDDAWHDDDGDDANKA